MFIMKILLLKSLQTEKKLNQIFKNFFLLSDYKLKITQVVNCGMHCSRRHGKKAIVIMFVVISKKLVLIFPSLTENKQSRRHGKKAIVIMFVVISKKLVLIFPSLTESKQYRLV